jgi:hypothetical protein
MLTPTFTDHHAIMLRINLQIFPPTRGRGYWEMNVSHLLEDTCLTDFMDQWEKWQTHKNITRPIYGGGSGMLNQ